MITEKEINATLLSATHKDYYQIWMELIELASKISERWDPSTTNESDPGIVLLKLLTGIADKLNYNIDKNVLECFLPSAAQEESMRKLCDMLGYSMKYYRSATTNVTVSYNGLASDWQADSVEGSGSLVLPIYTQITNIDNDITYTTTEQANFSLGTTTVTIPCIEGILKYCGENNNNIITINNIDDNNRYYLPSTQVAENGIFIYNISNDVWSTKWEQVDNLNSQELQKKIYKFGYDSVKFLPYIEFPSDISSLISDGLQISYITTNGLNGNTSAKTLTKFETPSVWTISDSENYNKYNTTGISHVADEFTCSNESAATNGVDKESLNNAYTNFKKTIGTFDTLVTCRDYMNKIYTLVTSDIDTTPLVSNSIVTDIRSDINNAVTLCTFDSCGLKYSDRSLTYTTDRTVYAKTDVSKSNPITISEEYNKIDHFDLVLYPFKTVSGLNSKDEYVNSFRNADTLTDKSTGLNIISELTQYKTISHKLNIPEESGDIMCIKNYLRLNAKITTTKKVNSIEWAIILNNIKTALYENFNCRQLDFSESIPFDSILSVIQEADTNIKNVSLEEPDLYTSFMTVDNKEYLFSTYYNDITDDEIIAKFIPSERIAYFDKTIEERTAYLAEKRLKAKSYYNTLAVRNILAGRVSLFNYDKEFNLAINEKQQAGVELVYPTATEVENNYYISSLEPSLIVNNVDSTDTVLTDNQIIQFRAPNFKTSISYPAYVNYYIKLTEETLEYAKPATFITLYDYFNKNYTVTGETEHSQTAFMLSALLNKYGNYESSSYMKQLTSEEYDEYIQKYGNVFTKNILYPIKPNGISDLNNYKVYFIDEASDTDIGKIKDISIFSGHIYEVTADLRYKKSGEIYTQDSGGSYLKIANNYTENGHTITEKYIKIDDYIKSSAQYYYYKLFTTDSNFKDPNNTNTINNYIASTEKTSGCWIYVLENNSYGIWYNWIQQITEFKDSDYEITLSGIYKNLGGDQSRTVGKFIDENKNKYQLSTTWYSTSTNPMLFYYIQQPHLGDKETTVNTETKVTTWGYTSDGFGEDATYNSLTANSEYELKQNEFLCINYTQATSEVSETTSANDTGAYITSDSSIVNTYYGPGTIICPNFAIMSSDKKKTSGTSYSKQTGYDFSSDLGVNFKNKVPGMYSLGSDEQIDIREPVSVYVYDESNTESEGFSPIYVYFSLNDEQAIATNNEVLFLEGKTLDTEGNYTVYSRILNEGEYFWYTDKNKQTLTYCGSGSEIINWSTTTIKKALNQNAVSTEDILLNGISVVPWISMHNLYVKDPENPVISDNCIKWNEYQYITLIATDTLKKGMTIGQSIENPETPIIDSDTTLTKDWKYCSNVKYICDGVESELPKISVSSSINMQWQVRTKLAVSLGPSYGQHIISENNTEEKLTANYSKVKDENFKDEPKTKQDFENIWLKANYTINSSLDKIYTTYDLYNEYNILIETVTDFKLRPFDSTTIYINEASGQPTALSLNNMNDYYTSFNFENYIELSDVEKQKLNPYTKIYSTIKDTTKGYNLIMFYYKTDLEVPTSISNLDKYVHIRVADSSKNIAQVAGTRSGNISELKSIVPFETIFNLNNKNSTESSKESWWQVWNNEESIYQPIGISRANSTAKINGEVKNITTIDDYNKFVKSAIGTVYKLGDETNKPGYLVLVYDNTKYKLEIPATTFEAGNYADVTFAGIDDDYYYCLRPGINIIKISDISSASIEIYPGEDLTESIIFGQLTSIKDEYMNTDDSDLGLNLDLLDYQVTTTKIIDTAKELLSKINKLDENHDFYYNAKLEDSLEIDINTDANENLAYEPVWYDYNNINNNFVISEIDADYLDTGITLARSSSK